MKVLVFNREEYLRGTDHLPTTLHHYIFPGQGVLIVDPTGWTAPDYNESILKMDEEASYYNNRAGSSSTVAPNRREIEMPEGLAKIIIQSFTSKKSVLEICNMLGAFVVTLDANTKPSQTP